MAIDSKEISKYKDLFKQDGSWQEIDWGVTSVLEKVRTKYFDRFIQVIKCYRMVYRLKNTIHKQ